MRKEIIGSQIGISGSNGHIGSRLFERLDSFGKTPVRLDRFGNVPEGINQVYDLASFGNKYSQKNEEEIWKANVGRVIDLLNNARNCKSIILTSSSSVLLPIETPYSQSKKEMEEYAKEFVKRTKANVVICRPSTITGVGESEDRLIPKLIHSTFSGEEMDFVGEPTHDYLDVEDYINAILFLASKAKEFRGHVFNVSFGVSISNEQIKDIVADITKRKPNIRRVKSMRKYDTKDWVVPNDKLRVLGWSPKKTVFDSVTEMVEEYKSKYGQNK